MIIKKFKFATFINAVTVRAHCDDTSFDVSSISNIGEMLEFIHKFIAAIVFGPPLPVF